MELTDEILDKLGFTEYWAGCGEFGGTCSKVGGAVLQTIRGEFDFHSLHKNKFGLY